VSDPTRVEIAGQGYDVVPQRIGRIRRKLSLVASVFGEMGEGDTESAIESAGGQLHELFCVFVPDFMPEWQFEGYASASAAEEDIYDETGDRSPSVPELIDLLEAIYDVNGGTRLARLIKSVVSPQVLKGWVDSALTAARIQRSERLLSSPPPSGESAPTSSTTSDPTSPPIPEPSELGPSPDPEDSRSPGSSTFGTATEPVTAASSGS
jgi:hypothetical protein